MGKVIIPENYKSCLSRYETQEAIGAIKNLMQKKALYGIEIKKGDRAAVCRPGFRAE